MMNKPNAAREGKHLSLFNSIKILEKTCDQFEQFHSELVNSLEVVENRIEGGLKTPGGQPSFSAVLTESPGKLMDINNRLLNILGSLKDVLY